jgi:hypothetical protein
VVPNRIGDGEICDARLHDDAAVRDIDLQDTAEFAQPEQHAVLEGQRSAG